MVSAPMATCNSGAWGGPLSHDDALELVPLAAAGALGRAEEDGVGRHLSVCPDCLRELMAYGSALGDLGLLARPVTPRESLRRRLLQAAATDPQAALPREHPLRR